MPGRMGQRSLPEEGEVLAFLDSMMNYLPDSRALKNSPPWPRRS